MHNRIINNEIDLIQEEIYCYGAGLDVFGLENQVVRIHDNLIHNNHVNTWWGGGGAVVLGTAGKLVFENNIVSNNSFQSENVSGGGGFYLWGDENYDGSIFLNGNVIKNNQSSGSSTHGYGLGGGVYIENCKPAVSNNLIINNRIAMNNWTGIEMFSDYIPCSSNIIYHNNLFNNSQNAYDEFSNNWYNSTINEGNYWSDFDEPSEGAYDNNTDGLVDTPYIIDIRNNDSYPLIKPWGQNPAFTFFTNSTVNRTLYLDASSSLDRDGEIVSLQWNFGDGSTASGYDAEHEYTRDGSYNLSLTITDNDSNIIRVP